MFKKVFLHYIFNYKNYYSLLLSLIFVVLGDVCFKNTIIAQTFDDVKVTGVFSGGSSNNTLFKAVSSTIPSLAYIRAQRFDGPQNGVFTQQGDNIRYTTSSTVTGIPGNLSRIRFTFLQSDKRTPIPNSNLRFIINDIDGPDNEALATSCDSNLRYLGTANPTNLIVANLPPSIIAVGSREENDGPTSRVMFEFDQVSVVELDNYANDGYLKDFDMDDDYPISKPMYVNCKTFNTSLYTQSSPDIVEGSVEFKKDSDFLVVNTNPIYFDLNKYDIRDDAKIELEKVVAVMNKYPEIVIIIHSHTDSRALDDYNMKLSIERAKSTANWIVERGINSSRISSEGFGETKLVNECANGVECTEEQHQLNRRTEFIVVNPEVINEN